jgi:hypothetical protein
VGIDAVGIGVVDRRRVPLKSMGGIVLRGRFHTFTHKSGSAFRLGHLRAKSRQRMGAVAIAMVRAEPGRIVRRFNSHRMNLPVRGGAHAADRDSVIDDSVVAALDDLVDHHGIVENLVRVVRRQTMVERLAIAEISGWNERKMTGGQPETETKSH